MDLPVLIILVILIIVVYSFRNSPTILNLNIKNSTPAPSAPPLAPPLPAISQPTAFRAYLTDEEIAKKYPSGLRRVSTFPAGEFICENCGKNSYFSLITLDKERITESQKAELLADLPDGHIILHPNVVQCVFCKEHFFVELGDTDVEEVPNGSPDVS